MNNWSLTEGIAVCSDSKYTWQSVLWAAASAAFSAVLRRHMQSHDADATTLTVLLCRQLIHAKICPP